MSKVKVSAGIVTYNCKEKAVNAVNSILKHTKGCDLTLSVYDNASVDGAADAIKNIEGVNFVSTGGNLGFGKAHNFALSGEMGKYHAVINPDITIESDVISKLVDILEQNDDIAIITPQILNSDKTVQHLPKYNPTYKFLFLGRLSKFFKPFKKIRAKYTGESLPQNKMSDIEFCTGCFFVIRSDVFKNIGGFDDNFFMYMEDADITRRALKFGRAVYCPTVSVTHLWERESAKSLKYLLIHLKSTFYYFKKWRKENKK